MTIPDNYPPEIQGPETPTVIFAGQQARVHVKATDPEGSKVMYKINRPDAYITSDGYFHWRSETNTVDGGPAMEVFEITASDNCNGTSKFSLEVTSTFIRRFQNIHVAQIPICVVIS